ncbi:MAG: trypsin-like peptidase domain-containing protein [Ruminococcus sp.]|nr:trypsin-like peptidase domain-containing protein [Ruminococcus sp.]
MKGYANKMMAVLTTIAMLVCSISLGSSADTYSVNTTLAYNVYDAKTGELIGDYTLTPNAFPTSNSSRIMIGDEDREIDYSKSGVVDLNTRYLQSSPNGGTGFVVDSHTIATAAHCAWMPKAGTSWIEGPNIVTIESLVLYNSDGTTAKTVTNAVQIHIPKAYINNFDELSVRDNPYDYALITVTDDLTDFDCFELGVMREEFKGSEVQVSMTGFPSEVDELDTDGEMYTGIGKIVQNLGIHDVYRRVCYDVDTSKGNSGGPVYITTQYKKKEYYTVIAIHSAGDEDNNINVGTRITTDLMHFYNNNPNIAY